VPPPVVSPGASEFRPACVSYFARRQVAYAEGYWATVNVHLRSDQGAGAECPGHAKRTRRVAFKSARPPFAVSEIVARRFRRAQRALRTFRVPRYLSERSER
jgi:hypothetical protein